MAKWILLNSIDLGAQFPGAANIHYFPGEIIDDTQQSTAPIVAGGGILWPATDPAVAACAVLAQQKKLRGNAAVAFLSSQLLAAAFYSLAGGVGGPVLGPAAVANIALGTVQKRTLTVTNASFTAAATSATLNIGAALPANARILSRELRIATSLTGGGVTAVTCSVGVAGTTTGIVNAQDVFGTSGNIAGTAGSDPQPLLATGPQLIATFTSTTANLNALTAGNMTIDLLFTQLP